MKKFVILFSLLLTISFGAFSQSKIETKAPRKDSTAKVTPTATIKADTAIITGVKVIQLDNGQAVNVDVLKQVLNSSTVVATDEYRFTLFKFMKTSKNPDYSSDEQDRLLSFFLPYVQRYQEAIKKQPDSSSGGATPTDSSSKKQLK